MPRKGKTTLYDTSVSELITQLIDKFIEENREEFTFIKLSRAKVTEMAILKFLESRGNLEQFLKDLAVSDSEVKSIKRYLQAVS